MRNGRGYRTRRGRKNSINPNIISADVGADKRMEAANSTMPMVMQGCTTLPHPAKALAFGLHPTEKRYRAGLLGTYALAFALAFHWSEA